MPDVIVSASTTINATAACVHQVLVDFNTWPLWSPWLYMEPEAEVSYRGNAGEPDHGYSWNGNKVGAGDMSLTSNTPSRIDCNLQFIKPFKSSALVHFELDSSDDEKTQLSWHMHSKLPFYMFWMKSTMAAMIRSDYQRGLALLKDYIELGEINSSSKIVGTVDVDTLVYVGRQRTSGMEDLSASMEQSFHDISTGLESVGSAAKGMPFTIYNKMNLKADRCTYTAALPADNILDVAPPLLSAERPACHALKVVHTGPYRHLSNAWAMLMGEARHRKLTMKKGMPPFEHYMNDPENIPEKELLTELYLPLK